MRRYVVWLVSALVALPVYVLTKSADLSQLLVLALTFVGAMGGAAIGSVLMQRR